MWRYRITSKFVARYKLRGRFQLRESPVWVRFNRVPWMSHSGSSSLAVRWVPAAGRWIPSSGKVRRLRSRPDFGVRMRDFACSESVGPAATGGGRVFGASDGIAVRANFVLLTTRGGRQTSNIGGDSDFRHCRAPSAVVQCLRIDHNPRARANLGQEPQPATVSRRLGSTVAIRLHTINFEKKSVAAGWEPSTRLGISL